MKEIKILLILLLKYTENITFSLNMLMKLKKNLFYKHEDKNKIKLFY